MSERFEHIDPYHFITPDVNGEPVIKPQKNNSQETGENLVINEVVLIPEQIPEFGKMEILWEMEKENEEK